MTHTTAPGYPRELWGRLALVHGITAGTWLLTRGAMDEAGPGVSSGQLELWSNDGIISYRQQVPKGPRRFLSAEMAELAKLPTDERGRLPLRFVRKHIADQAAGRGTATERPNPPAEGDEVPGYPQEHLGRLAVLHGIETGTWIAPWDAVREMGLRFEPLTLARLSNFGLISSRQARPDHKPSYLREELIVLRKLHLPGLPLKALRQHLAELERRTA